LTGQIALLLLAGGLLTGPVHGHPELLAQIELINDQLAAQPQNTELLLRRGDLYRRHGDHGAAERDFATVRRLDPDNDLLDFYAGRLQLETGAPGRADESLSRYLARHPEHASAWVLRGRARLARGLPLAAAGDFAGAIAHSSRPTPSLYLQQAMALLAAGEKHLDSARAAADTGLARHPQDVALLGLATDIALVRGQGAAASGYLGTLPGALADLPQWRSRRESTDCLQRGEATTVQCAAPARERLDQRLREQALAAGGFSDREPLQ
jgi:predicted Zn-dependent protease